MSRYIDAYEYEKRIKPYDTEDKMDKALYNFAHNVLICCSNAEVKPIIYCKDCKWWKESDGTYKRGLGAESKCPMNTETVYKGEGYCYMAEPKEGEEEE